MKVSVAVVTSLDSRMTHGDQDDIHSWTSEEDHDHFESLLNSHDVLVMGSNTYELMRDGMKRKPGRLRVVLTSRPKEYAAQQIPGQLEFHDKTPAETVEYLEAKNYKNLLIVGGGRMITDFIKSGLVDHLYLTLEPKLFGEGNLLITEPIDQELQLTSVKQLNDRGTLLLTYSLG